MLSVQKKGLLFALLAASHTLFAGEMGETTCAAINATVPCAQTAWDVGVKGLYLMPLMDQQYNGLALNTENNTSSLVGGTLNSSWGVKLEGSYHFSTGNDLNLNGYSLMGEGTSRFALVEESAGLSSITSLRRIHLKPTWNAVNLEWGQRLNLGDFDNVRLHGGLQYANIDMRFDARTVNDSITSIVINGVAFPVQLPYTAVNTRSSTFYGIGPRFGADAAYQWPNRISVYGNAAGAILIGSMKYAEFNSNNTVPGGVIFFPSRNSSGKKTAVVPEVEGKLGLAYSHRFGLSSLTVDGGWMTAYYFNAFLSTLDSNSDFALQGPFLGIKWIGHIA